MSFLTRGTGSKHDKSTEHSLSQLHKPSLNNLKINKQSHISRLLPSLLDLERSILLPRSRAAMQGWEFGNPSLWAHSQGDAKGKNHPRKKQDSGLDFWIVIYQQGEGPCPAQAQGEAQGCSSTQLPNSLMHIISYS